MKRALLCLLFFSTSLACGVAPLQGYDMPSCGTHPEDGRPIYCACIRACEGQHQCTLHEGVCAPTDSTLCPVLDGYSRETADIEYLLEVTPCK